MRTPTEELEYACFSLVPFQHFNLFLHTHGTFFMYITTNHIDESLAHLLNDLLLASATSISKFSSKMPKKTVHPGLKRRRR